MDTGLSIRPPASVTQTGYVRPDPAPVREAVATDLAASQSVTAAADVARVRNDATTAQQAQSREIVLDPHNREVIYRVVDVRSGQVVRQVPDEAMLRLRAYTRALSQGVPPIEADSKTDRQV